MNKRFNIKHRQVQKRSMIRTEDGLTYNVFNRLSYLSKQTFENIFNSAFNLQVQFEELIEMSFWPKWNVKEIPEIKNKNYIEPDLFFRFKSTDVIIEVKRYDLNQQSEKQWKDQIKTYRYHYGVKKELIYIPLGGMNYSQLNHPDAIIKQSYWFKLAQSSKNMLAKDQLDFLQQRILKDVLETLKFYNHIPLEFLNSLKPIDLHYSNNIFKR